MKSLTVYSRTFGAGCLFFVLPLLCWSQDGAATAPKSLLEPAVNQLKIDLNQAQALMPAVADLAARERLNALLTDAQSQAARLPQNQGPPDKAFKPAPVSFKPAPVSMYQIMQLSKGLRTETFDAGKVSYIQQISRTHYFTAAQARLLLAAFDFDEGRADAAAALYPHIVDPDDFPAVLDVFTFDAGRDEACKRLKL